jgi:hypothetical protein
VQWLAGVHVAWLMACIISYISYDSALVKLAAEATPAIRQLKVQKIFWLKRLSIV